MPMVRFDSWVQIIPCLLEIWAGGTASAEILIDSDDSGLCMIAHRESGDIYMFNHLEYDTDTLKQEYLRDLETSADFPPPDNYFADDRLEIPKPNVWRSQAYLMFNNWTYWIYEEAPHDLSKLPL